MKASEFITKNIADFDTLYNSIDAVDDDNRFICVSTVKKLLQKIGSGDIRDDVGDCQRRHPTVSEQIEHREGFI